MQINMTYIMKEEKEGDQKSTLPKQLGSKIGERALSPFF